MSWSISTRNISRISNFDSARLAWERAVPWKNRPESWRQLGERRAHHKRIVKLNDDRGYECVLFNTPVVTYWADGSVTLRTYDTQSTQAFAWCVKPTGCMPASTRSRMFWNVKTDDGDRYYQPATEALHLKPTPAGNWLLTTEPAKHFEQKYDPKKGAAVRKTLKAYTTWFAAAQRLGAHIKVSDPWSRTIGRVARHPKDNFQNPESFIQIAQDLGPPESIRGAMYQLELAHYNVPAPYDRLPRTQS